MTSGLELGGVKSCYEERDIHNFILDPKGGNSADRFLFFILQGLGIQPDEERRWNTRFMSNSVLFLKIPNSTNNDTHKQNQFLI